MSTPGPSLPSRKLWERREAHFLSVAKMALESFHRSRPHLEAECALNRELYFELLTASRVLDPEGNEPAITQEACNQPDPDDTSRAKREAKRPDFQWVYLDPHEPDPRRAARQFIIECKRLGDSGNSTWRLNENYVSHGIARFVLPDWGYAQGASSALMIGYWQNLPASQILREVNAALAAHPVALPVLEPKPGTALSGSIAEFRHTLSRSFAASSFALTHWWVDVR